jgi:hypothetical protein
MAATVKISRILSVSGDPTNARITIKVQVEDGSESHLLMDGPTAHALVPTVRQAVLKLADLIRSGPKQPGQLQVLDIQSVHMGYDPQTNMSVILFDQGKPSETAFRLPEKLVRELELGLAQVTKALSGKSRGQHH